VSQKRYADDEIKALWRDVANWKWDPKTHGAGHPLVVPILQEPNPGQPLEALDRLEFRIVRAGTGDLKRDSVVCEGVVVADESNFAWLTRPCEFFATRHREDGSHDVYRMDRSQTGDVIYCETITANNTEKQTTAGPWSVQQFLGRDDLPDLAKGIVSDLCVPRVARRPR
jgi:hypothetical protein